MGRELERVRGEKSKKKKKSRYKIIMSQRVFSSKTLIGNFFEDQVAKTAKMSKYLANKERGTLAIQQV
jgi:hypothetical protein